MARYQRTKNRIGKALAVARRNKYALEVFNQANELQVYPALLILGLEKVDKASGTNQRRSALSMLSNTVDSFELLRKKYEAVLGRTRIINNPPDYVPDQNHHHHLANGTVNYDWMFVYELAANEKIRQYIISNMQNR